jgi:hypothetical protein
MDEVSNVFSCLFVEFSCLHAECVDTTVNIAVVIAVEVDQSVYYLAWFLSRGCVVKVDERAAVDLPF